MYKTISIIIIAIIFICLYFLVFRYRPGKNIQISIKNQPFDVEIAKTIAQKSKGLSKRSFLCPNCGMLFIFDFNSTQPFWMKDTLIPLDMIWLDSLGKIVDIQTAVPEPNTPITKLKIYQNSTPAKFVIELNSGVSQQLDLKIGDTINIPSTL
jgi:uncharacterized protein